MAQVNSWKQCIKKIAHQILKKIKFYLQKKFSTFWVFICENQIYIFKFEGYSFILIIAESKTS